MLFRSVIILIDTHTNSELLAKSLSIQLYICKSVEQESISTKLGVIIDRRMSCICTLTDLKRRFGQYTIMIRENPEKNIDLKELIKEILPEAKKAASTGEKAQFFKVDPEHMKFSAAFNRLEQARANEDIKDFSIYTSTLDQIFIKLAKYQRSST